MKNDHTIRKKTVERALTRVLLFATSAVAVAGSVDYTMDKRFSGLSATQVPDFTLTAPFVHTSTTRGSHNDCAFRKSEERTYCISIESAGEYTFTTDGTSWDTYLYLTSALNNGDVLGSNDDYEGLKSQFTAFLQPGKYYLEVEGFGSTDVGAYLLGVQKTSSEQTLGIAGASSAKSGSVSSYSITPVSGAFSYLWTVVGGTITSGQGTSAITIAWGSNTSGSVTVVPVDARDIKGDGATLSVKMLDESNSPTLNQSGKEIKGSCVIPLTEDNGLKP